MKSDWRWKGVTEGGEYQKVGRARVTMVLGAGIITLVLLSLVILYTPSASGVPFVSETYIENMPFRYQSKYYYCGPASLQMVYAFYGIDINQYYVAEVARTDSNTGTGGWDILRSGHFSNLSSSIGYDDPWFDCSGYPGRDLGYASFYWSSVDQNFTEAINYLYDLIDEGYPIIVALWPDAENYYIPDDLAHTGHCVVVVGYGSSTELVYNSATHSWISIVSRWVIVNDPWNSILWGGVGGPNRTIGWDDFEEMWVPYDYSMYFIHPWMVDVTDVSVNASSPFVVTANITYPCPEPFPRGLYLAYTSKATIDLPRSFSLSPGETPTKTVGSDGVMTAGSSSTISWNVIAPSEANTYEVEVEAEGKVNAWMWIGPGNMQPNTSYTYTDRIGGSGIGSVTFLEREQTETPAEITNQKPIDSNGVPKSSFVLGETVLASSTVTNIGPQNQPMVIIVQWTDPQLRALAPIVLITDLDPGDDLTFAPGLIIPTTGYTTGTWTATIMVLSDWPANNGETIGVPVTINITVS